MYDFDQLLDRRNTSSIKWDRQTSEGDAKNLMPFAIADMDFHCCPAVKEALVNRASHPSYGYTFVPDEFFTSYIDWSKRHYDLDVKREEIVSAPGIVPGFAFILHAMTEPGDKILVSTPLYDPFFQVITRTKRQRVDSSLHKEGNHYTFDFEDMEAKFKDGVKMYILCNPHNPTGRAWTVAELTQLVALCRKYNVLLFSDEIHCDILFGNRKHVSIFNIEGADEITILGQAPSKTFNIAGLKSAILVVRNQALCQQVRDVLLDFRMAVNIFGWAGSAAAYAHGDQWAEELVEYLEENSKVAVDFFKTHLPKVNAYVPEATYLLWLDFSAYGLSQEDLMNKLSQEAGVKLNDGSHYGVEGVGFARLNVATQRARLMEGLQAIQSVFETL